MVFVSVGRSIAITSSILVTIAAWLRFLWFALDGNAFLENLMDFIVDVTEAGAYSFGHGYATGATQSHAPAVAWSLLSMLTSQGWWQWFDAPGAEAHALEDDALAKSLGM